MTDRTNKDINAAYKRRYMIHVCKDGTVTYRDTAIGEKVFNGRALPVFSVDTPEEAQRIQIRFCRLQVGSHPRMPGKPWYTLTTFSGELEDLDRVRREFTKFYEEDKTAALVSKAARSRRPRKARKKCA